MAIDLREKFSVTVEGDILHIAVFKMIDDYSQTKAAIDYAQKSVDDIFNKDKSKIYNVLVEVLAREESAKLPKEVVEMFKGYARHPQIDKIAIYSQDLFMRMITNSVSYLTGKESKIRCFDQRAQALQWLKKN